MSVLTDIEGVLYLLRLNPAIDVERLCYVVNEAEWRELRLDIETHQPWIDLSYAESFTWKGLRVRKRCADSAPEERK